MGPKSFSAVMARKTTEQSERHTKFVNLLELGVKTKTPLATGLLDTVPLILSFKPSCLAVKTCNKRSRLQKDLYQWRR